MNKRNPLDKASKTTKSPVFSSRQNRTSEEFADEMAATMQRDQLIKQSKSK